jgi:hypothetical protein
MEEQKVTMSKEREEELIKLEQEGKISMNERREWSNTHPHSELAEKYLKQYGII